VAVLPKLCGTRGGYPAMGPSPRKRTKTSGKEASKIDWARPLAYAAVFALAHALDLKVEVPAPKPTLPRTGWPFWKTILLRVYASISEDRVLALAAGVVFYGLLALFPAITALVSSYALFADPGTVGQHLANLAVVMPAGALDIVNEQVMRIVGGATGKLSVAFVTGLVLAIWSANAGVKAIIDALNVAYGMKERRGFVVLNLVSLAFTICAIVGILLAFGGIVIVPVVLSYLPFEGAASLVQWLRWPALAALLLLALALLYRFGPDHVHPRWHWITPGAVFAAAAWIASSALLSWYLANFADYNKTYGSLGAAIGLMTWMWVSAIVVLTGAELNAELDRVAADAEELAERSNL
jgi:membrane protein